jgi:hypothetical protein
MSGLPVTPESKRSASSRQVGEPASRARVSPAWHGRVQGRRQCVVFSHRRGTRWLSPAGDRHFTAGIWKSATRVMSRDMGDSVAPAFSALPGAPGHFARFGLNRHFPARYEAQDRLPEGSEGVAGI